MSCFCRSHGFPSLTCDTIVALFQVRALDILFILHADHEFNCSTTTMRTIASSGVDVYSAVAGACAALYGPSHGKVAPVI